MNSENRTFRPLPIAAACVLGALVILVVVILLQPSKGESKEAEPPPPPLPPEQVQALRGAMAADVASGAAVGDGVHQVGDGPGLMLPGIWKMDIPDDLGCYWERHDAGGNLIENEYLTTGPSSATITTGETFISQHCGGWRRVGEVPAG